MDSNNFKFQSDDLKPRERMNRAGSASVLSSVELLMVLLKTGSRGCDVGEMSRRLVNAFGGVDNLVRCDLLEIKQKVESYNYANPQRKIGGLGKVKIQELAAAFELVRRGYGEDITSKRSPITTSIAAYQEFKKAIPRDAETEFFLILPLNRKRVPLCDAVRVASGTSDSASISPREVFKNAVRWNASAIIIAHNHPTGTLTPSKEDVKFTQALVKTSEIVGIALLDHLILGREFDKNRDFLSMAEATTIQFAV